MIIVVNTGCLIRSVVWQHFESLFAKRAIVGDEIKQLVFVVRVTDCISCARLSVIKFNCHLIQPADVRILLVSYWPVLALQSVSLVCFVSYNECRRRSVYTNTHVCVYWSTKKLSYRRDNARRRSLRRSRSFKVIDVGTVRKPVCDFLLVNNTNLHPISHRFQVIADYWSNVRFRQGYTCA